MMADLSFTDIRDWAARWSNDQRWQAIRFGLDQLTCDQLWHILDWQATGGEAVYDTVNFDPKRGLWCPLAIGLQVPEVVRESGAAQTVETDEAAKSVIKEIGQSTCRGFTLNPVKGVPGRIFRKRRARDVNLMCIYILRGRISWS